MGAQLQSMLDGIIPGSDPNASSYVQSQQQIARQQQLAQAMIDQGTSSAPIASPWQGAANLAKAMLGGYMNRQAIGNQRLAQSDATADMSNVLNSKGFLNDPGEQSIPSTPGRTTPALQQNDQINDATADAVGNGANPNAAIAAALAASRGGQPQSMGGVPAGGSPPSNSYSPLAAAMMPPTIAPTSGAPLDPSAYPNTQQGHAAYIQARAASLGIDPTFAMGVANAEGLRALSPSNPNGASTVDRNPDGTPFSFGDFQLNVRNGLGNAARAAGIDPANPADWQRADDFALSYMAKNGLAPWKGDAAVEAYRSGNPGVSSAPAVAAINAATRYGGPTATAADGSAVPTNAQGYAIDPRTGQPTQGAGAPSASPSPVPAVGTMSGVPAPSQRGAIDRLSPAAMADPRAAPAVPPPVAGAPMQLPSAAGPMPPRGGPGGLDTATAPGRPSGASAHGRPFAGRRRGREPWRRADQQSARHHGLAEDNEQPVVIPRKCANRADVAFQTNAAAACFRENRGRPDHGKGLVRLTQPDDGSNHAVLSAETP